MSILTILIGEWACQSHTITSYRAYRRLHAVSIVLSVAISIFSKWHLTEVAAKLVLLAYLQYVMILLEKAISIQK